jgi:Putative Ig domain
MPSALAVNTFDTIKFYLSTRTHAAPGSGTWSVDSVIADASLISAGGYGGCTMGAVLSSASLPAGMMSSVTGVGVYYLGPGLPATPVLVTTPSTAAHYFQLRDYWNVEDGAWSVNGALWCLLDNHDPAAIGFISMLKSTDGGNTWVVMDDAHSPSHSFHTAARWDGGHLVDTASFDSSFTSLTINTFDFNTGTWSGDSVAATTATSTLNIGNEIIRFSNGDRGVFYNFAGAYTALKYQLFSGGAWGGEVAIAGGPGNNQGYANAILDPAGNLVHLFRYIGGGGDGNLSTNGAPVYDRVTQAGVATLGIFTFPVYTSSDGIGHGKIGADGNIYAPYDNTGNTEASNDIWVATLGSNTFFKETIPKPAEQTAQITLFSLNPTGSGYAINDTGTVDGGVVPATYKITNVTTNAIGSIAIHSPNNSANFVVNDTGTINGGSSSASYKIIAINNGLIATLSGFFGGSGYAPGDTGTIDGGTLSATYKVDTVGGGGVVTLLEITFPGHGYSVASGVGTVSTSGVGSGLTVDISSVTNGSIASFVLTILGAGYSIASNVATTPTSGSGTNFFVDILSVFNGVSGFTLTSSGRGYSVANNVGLTATSGVGVGLTINILAIAGITPCCAYIPTELPVGALSLACPVAVTYTVGVPFSAQMVVTGGTSPFTFALIAGSLPPGLTLDPSTGIISGTPTGAGSFSYTIQVTDANGLTATVTCSLSGSAQPPPPPPTCETVPAPGYNPRLAVYPDPNEQVGS